MGRSGVSSLGHALLRRFGSACRTRIVRGASACRQRSSMSTLSFPALGVSAPIVRALEARGITEPFAIQRLVIADVLAGRDVLAKSPTGSGKTLAFGVPLLDRLDPKADRPAALVLAPTRELATQIVDELRSV